MAAILRAPGGGADAFVTISSRPDRASVGRRTPDARQSADAPRLDAKLAAEADERLFHQAHKVDRADAAAFLAMQAAEIEDGIADELSRAVIGDIAAAIDFVQRDAARSEQFVRSEHVGYAWHCGPA